MDKIFIDEEDVFEVVEQDIPNTIYDTTEVVNVTDDNDSVVVNELPEDVVSITMDEDSLIISDDVDNVNIQFAEILQPVVNNITNDNSVFSGIASEDLGGHRIVVAIGSQIAYADNTIAAHSSIVTGISTQAVLSGATLNVTISGEVSEGSWNWSLDKPIFLTANGLMTQTAPNTGFLLQVGYPTTITSMIVDIKTAIVLST